MLQYFKQPIELYYYINNIPCGYFSGKIDHFWFYVFILIFFVFSLILCGYFLMQGDLSKQKKVIKFFISFLFVFWFLTSIRWFLIQGKWLINDWQALKNVSLLQKQSEMMSRIIQGNGLPENWRNFREFLEFAKEEIPPGSKIYVLPADEIFWCWSRYWLYPELQLVDSSLKADYFISFNVNLQVVNGFEKIKTFSDNKFIYIKITNPQP